MSASTFFLIGSLVWTLMALWAGPSRTMRGEVFRECAAKARFWFLCATVWGCTAAILYNLPD